MNKFEKMGYDAAISGQWIGKAVRKRRVYMAGGSREDISDFAEGFRRGLAERDQANAEAIASKVGDGLLYRVTAEHCNGEADRSDPTDGFEMFVAANGEQQAEDVGIAELERLAQDQPERNNRGLPNCAGSTRWWNSVSVNLERLTFDDAKGAGIPADSIVTPEHA